MAGIEIQHADDGQVIEACESGLVGWETTEQAELGTETPSDDALRLRGVIHLMVAEGKDRREAEKAYDALLAAQKENEKRTIPTLEERVIKLHEDGQLTDLELEEFRADDLKVYYKIKALLDGADIKEADRYARLAKKEADAWKDLNGPNPSTKEVNNYIIRSGERV